MRFHCGFSFSWRTIKKFLFPFLLGILAYFGLSLINDDTALGFIKVNALEEDEVVENDDFVDSDHNGIDDEIDDNYNYWSSILSSDNSIEHKEFFHYVYWFDDNTTTIGILSNIYIILFLYCTGMLTLKFINIVRNTRWK